MGIRVGIDTVLVASVRDAMTAHGERYLARVYTAQEQADCAGDPERLAARFAAKEAAVKALRAAGGGLPWTAIEVVRDPTGPVDLALHGEAAALAEALNVTETAVSLTHEGGSASAVVVVVFHTGTKEAAPDAR
jgi:holo-[acyl-carrier protein] synthase